MLFTGTYLWMTFELSVRVSRVIDLCVTSPDGLVKQLTTGASRFRIHSLSQTGHIANLIHRIGFRIVGRRLQKRFADESLLDMQRPVAQTLAQQIAPTRFSGRPQREDREQPLNVGPLPEYVESAAVRQRTELLR